MPNKNKCNFILERKKTLHPLRVKTKEDVLHANYSAKIYT